MKKLMVKGKVLIKKIVDLYKDAYFVSPLWMTDDPDFFYFTLFLEDNIMMGELL